MPETTTLMVCVTCKPKENNEGGRSFYQALQDRLHERPDSSIILKEVECLSVCSQPATFAIGAAHKWSYIFAGLSVTDMEDVLAYVAQYSHSSDGMPPFKERPKAIRSRVVARLPPLNNEG